MTQLSDNPHQLNDGSATLRGLLAAMGIQPFIDDESITEIVVNRPYEIWTEGSIGWEKHTADQVTFGNLKRLAVAFAIFNSEKVTIENPIISGVFPDGQRGQFVLPPAVEDGTISMTIRRPSSSRFTVDDYASSGRFDTFSDVSSFHAHTLQEHPDAAAENRHRDHVDQLSKKLGVPPEVHLREFELKMLDYLARRDLDSFLKTAVANKQNIVLVGGTGSGKTTLTKAVCDLIPAHTRLVTIEDTHELNLPNHPNRVHLFYRKSVTPKQLVKSCLRMKPDRILLTELRGDETWDYLTALNTGHHGSVTTVHANDAEGAYARIATLVKQSDIGQTLDLDFIQREVYTTLDIAIYMAKTKVVEVSYNPIRKYRLLNPV